MSEIRIDTVDGSWRAFVYRPRGTGPSPAVLVYMDGIGIRPVMLAVGERLATQGYFVLLPDLFYRSGPYAPMNARTVFSDPDQRKVLMEKFFALATPAAASYHPSRLATDAADSPHRLAPRMRSRVYVAGATDDQSFPDESIVPRRDEGAAGARLTDAGVDHTIETYPARQGFVLSDTPAYDPDAAERHWRTLLALLGATLS